MVSMARSSRMLRRVVCSTHSLPKIMHRRTEMESASNSAPKGMLHAPLITSKRLEATLGRIMNVGCIKSSEQGAQYPLAVLRASISLFFRLVREDF